MFEAKDTGKKMRMTKLEGGDKKHAAKLNEILVYMAFHITSIMLVAFVGLLYIYIYMGVCKSFSYLLFFLKKFIYSISKTKIYLSKFLINFILPFHP